MTGEMDVAGSYLALTSPCLREVRILRNYNGDGADNIPLLILNIHCEMYRVRLIRITSLVNTLIGRF